jgi:hypothetical protein
MGHDIKIREGGPNGYVIAETSITGNFSNHKPSIHQLHGHSGKVIAPFLKRELEKLAKAGIKPRIEGLDGWGQYSHQSYLLQFAKKRVHEQDGWNGAKKGDEFTASWSDYEDKVPEIVHAINCMHAYHMQRFLDLAEKYPDGYWYSDQVWAVTPLDGDEGIPMVESDDEDEEEDKKEEPPKEEPAKPGFVIPMEKVSLLQGLYGIRQGDGVVYCYQHPIDGNKTICTAEDAMEAAKVAVSNKDQRAIVWTMIALIIQGAL